MPAIPITIGHQRFPSKVKAEEACKAILYRYEIGEIVARREDHDFLCAVLQLHPRAREKIGAGIVRFEIRRNPQYPSRRSIYLVRTDGSETEFGYNKCLNPPTLEKEVTAALRHTIGEQIIEFVRRVFGSGQPVRCAATGVEIHDPTDAHVDHAPPTFLDLVETFVAAHGGWSSFTLSRADGQVGARLTDPALASEWAAYHRQRAKIQVVTIKANLSDLKKARRGSP